MRTILDIDDDVLAAADEIAARRKETASVVISDLARAALARAEDGAPRRGGFTLMPAIGFPLTSEMVKTLLDE